MHIFYEEEGSLKAGTVLADQTTSLQVEALHGKRGKLKAQAVLLRFERPTPAELTVQAQALAASLDADFLWEVCPQEEFAYEDLAREYFGQAPDPVQAAGLLLKLHGCPMHFYKKGRGRYKSAPADALKAALASVERKRLQAEAQRVYVEQLTAFALPEDFRPLLPRLLYKPDKAGIEWKALEAACHATKLSPAHLLEKCGGIPSSRDYHLQRFLLEHFPEGTAFPELPAPADADLLDAGVQAFSIDDVTTTEIDDAFSVASLPGGGWRVGIHIAAPALGVHSGDGLDAVARRRLSTVYMPGDKITMLPEAVIHRYTLGESLPRPACSLYLTLSPELDITDRETRLEQVTIAANLRHDALEPVFNEATLAQGKIDHPFGPELKLLWQLAQRLEAGRGKANEAQRGLDYNFYVEAERIRIAPRRRGSPLDKLVAELMIHANAEWGRQLAEHGIPGIYRVQSNGKVKMSTVPAPHQGLGVAQYLWASSPLRRYVDLLNQRQIIAMIRGDAPAYEPGSEILMAAMREFELAYEVYGDFQRTMERYWCLRWLLQENVREIGAEVVRESLVRLEGLPLVTKALGMTALAEGSAVRVAVGSIDLLDLTLQCRYVENRDRFSRPFFDLDQK